MRVSLKYSKWQRAEENFNSELEELEFHGHKIKDVSLSVGDNDIVYALIVYEENKEEL